MNFFTREGKFVKEFTDFLRHCAQDSSQQPFLHAPPGSGNAGMSVAELSESQQRL
jgi:hypothetical protein